MNIETGEIKYFTEEEEKHLDKSKWKQISQTPLTDTLATNISKFVWRRANKSKYMPHIGKKERQRKGLE